MLPWHPCLAANYRCSCYVSQSPDAVSFFDAWTSKFCTKHNQSHFNHSTFMSQLLNNRGWTYCPYLHALCFIYTWLTVWRSARLPGVMHMFEGLTSDPKQDFFVGTQTQSFTRSYLPLQTGAHVYRRGCTNAQPVPQELLSDGCCFLSACRCHCLITSHHSPFTSQLI